MNKPPMSEEERKANRRWWIVMATFTALLIILNYKHLPSLLAELAMQGLTIVTWLLWIKACMDIYAFFASRRQLSEWGFINLGAALCCSLLLWIINDSAKEVLGILYFAVAAAAVVTVVFHPGKK
ncbi:MAG TPA: hypothetical protein VNH42_07920 [Mariprofundaceae bacterium]|nr:hypothetical protein [Mariprofundaceae bacterium]